MEAYSTRESGMRDRVAETSISAQKIVDERHGPFRSAISTSYTHKGKDFSHFYIAHSGFKGKEEGCTNSFKAARYYLDEGKKYREQLLQEVQE